MHVVSNAPRRAYAALRFSFFRSCYIRVRTRSIASPQAALLTAHRYLCARFDDMNEATLKPKMKHYAKAGHVLALHTPLMMKARPFAPLLYFPSVPHQSQEFCDGVFGDAFFSKQNVSSEKDARKTRTDVQSAACNACVDAFCTFFARISFVLILPFS
jgi:hypothetical protein